jgi:hypothetical protein
LKERGESLKTYVFEIFFLLVPSVFFVFCLKDGEISKRFVLCRFKCALAKIFWHRPPNTYVIVLTTFLDYEYVKETDMNEILSSQVHEHIFGGDDENNNLNGPRRLLAENLDYQQMELTTEDREDHTFNGEREVVCLFFTSFCRETHTLDDDDERTTNPY